MTTNEAVKRIAEFLDAHRDARVIVAANTRAELVHLAAESNGVFPSVMLTPGAPRASSIAILDAFGLGGIRVMFANIRSCTGWRALYLDAVITIGDMSGREIECHQMCARQSNHEAELIQWEALNDE